MTYLFFLGYALLANENEIFVADLLDVDTEVDFIKSEPPITSLAENPIDSFRRLPLALASLYHDSGGG